VGIGTARISISDENGRVGQLGQGYEKGGVGKEVI
jgi:hypothetical protein